MEQDTLKSLIEYAHSLPDNTPLPPDKAQELYSALTENPYMVILGVLLLRHQPAEWSDGSEQIRHTRHIVALCSPCRNTVFAAAHGSEWTKFYPQAEPPARHDTGDVIDTFLSTYGHTTPEEEAQLERLIFNPTPDYAEMLARQEQQELPPADDNGADPDSPDARINAFIRLQHPARPVPPEPKEKTPSQHPVKHPRPADDSLLSESLAQIFIKQGRFSRAYEIISNISLKYPKKSAYFADQLRFLQKLIINQRCLERRNGIGTDDKQ